MNKQEWKKFYSMLRYQAGLGSSIATFSMDFSMAWRRAIPDEARQVHLWATGFETKLWYFALTLYGSPFGWKLRDRYHPFTEAWRRRSLGLPYRKEA